MPPIDDKVIVQRIDELLATKVDEEAYQQAYQALQGTLTLLGAVHGRGSRQEATLLQVLDFTLKKKQGEGSLHSNFIEFVWPAVSGALHALKEDVQAGLVGDLRRRAVGEVVSDMLGLAKAAVAEGTKGSKNVAAVLAGAAYEDTVRRMGATLADVQGRPKLEEVVGALKEANVLQGSEVGIVLSHLNFRNGALHADWTRVTDTGVNSCINLVEHLLLKHFS